MTVPETGNTVLAGEPLKSAMDTSPSMEIAAKTFIKFPDLPPELRLCIIGIAADDAYRSPFGVTRLYTRVTPATLRHESLGTGNDARRALLSVNCEFKVAYLEKYPLCFAVYRDGKEVFPASVPFNFDTDQIVIPQNLLELPADFDIPDLKKVKKLIILWSSARCLWDMADSCVGRLMDLPLPTFKERAGGYIALLHERFFRPKSLAAVPKYGSFTGYFSEHEKHACDVLVRRLCLHPEHDRTFSYGFVVWSMRLNFDFLDTTRSPMGQKDFLALSEVVGEQEAEGIFQSLKQSRAKRQEPERSNRSPLVWPNLSD